MTAELWFNNDADFVPGTIGADFTGPEVFELVRLAIDAQTENARAEVRRLIRRAKSNADALTDKVSPGIPGCHASQAIEDAVALQAARAQLAAVQTVWLAVMHGVAGPHVHSVTPESVEKSRVMWRVEARAKLDTRVRGPR